MICPPKRNIFPTSREFVITNSLPSGGAKRSRVGAPAELEMNQKEFDGALSGLFGDAHPWIFRGIGIGLLLFAVDIFAACRGARVSRGKALYFSIGDFGWVAGSVVLLVAIPLSAPAATMVTGVALIVLGFGVAQLRCLRGGSTQPA